MKRVLILTLSFVTGFAYGVYGKTFFMFKPSFLFNDPERRALLDTYGYKGMLQATVFGGKTDDSEKLARYFLPIDCACIRVTEDGSPNAHGTDVNALFLNVISVPLRDKTGAQIDALINQMTYDSQVRFCPKRSEIGVGFVARAQLPHDCWLLVATSIVSVRHTLGICEQIFNTGGAGPSANFGYASLCAAIQAGCPTWNYGKFYGGCLKETGVPEVELSAGYDCYNGEQGHVSDFIGVEIPTGSATCQRYLFAPQVGNGRHVGLFSGVSGNYICWQGEKITAALVTSGVIRYLCPRCEQRSFDMKNKPWSRYMLVWLNPAPLSDQDVAANVTAAFNRMDWLINYSTMCVDVAPGWSLDIDGAWQVTRNKWSFALGYHAYARQEEEICFCNGRFNETVGLQAFSNYLHEWTSADPLPTTCSFDTINSPMLAANAHLTDYSSWNNGTTSTYVPITLDRLDARSAQVPAALAQTLYATIGYQCDTRVPLKILLGALYTGSSDNKGMPSFWKAWASLALAF